MRTPPRPSAACLLLLLAAVLLAACEGTPATAPPPPTATPPPSAPEAGPTPLPTRTVFPPGEVLDYETQTGDTLPAVAAHFNTTVEAILEANPGLPTDLTTLPPGLPLRVPAYYLPLMGTPFKVLPDSEVVYGPSAVGFDVGREVRRRPGFLAGMSDYALGRERPAWEVVEVVARNYSLHPRLLLALLEYGSGALTRPFPDERQREYPLGYEDPHYRGLYRQLLWAAERLNDGYYGWREGRLREIELADGRITRPDPWQNAGTVALQNLFAGMFAGDAFERAIGPEGFYRLYTDLWGEPFSLAVEHIPGNLRQPELGLPFEPGKVWAFTGGPHPGWGNSLPWSALDFAPPAVVGGCNPSDEWVMAPAAGVVARSEPATVVLDLDGDGDERTGWVLFFYHMATEDRVPAGTVVARGDPLGHPSCEGGRSTGTHFHVARRYNGEWLPAEGVIPFVLDGWVPTAGAQPYQGALQKGSKVVPACVCSSRENWVLYELPGAGLESP